MLLRILVLCSFIILTKLTCAQSTSSGWIDYNHTRYLSPDFSIKGDVGYRTNFSGDDFNLFLLRPGVNYRINKTFQVQGNVAIFLTYNQEFANSREFRLAQEVRATWPRFKRFRFDHRVRAEERFFAFEQIEGIEDQRSSDQDVRLRYFLAGTSDYLNVGPLGNLFFTGSVEFFTTLGEETEGLISDRSRVYAGWGQLLNKGWSYAIHFIWQQSRNAFGNFESDEFVVRLRIYWKSQVPN